MGHRITWLWLTTFAALGLAGCVAGPGAGTDGELDGLTTAALVSQPEPSCPYEIVTLADGSEKLQCLPDDPCVYPYCTYWRARCEAEGTGVDVCARLYPCDDWCKRMPPGLCRDRCVASLPRP